jgi:hypothetical protein
MKKIITLTLVAILGFSTVSTFAMSNNFVSYTNIIKANAMTRA